MSDTAFLNACRIFDVPPDGAVQVAETPGSRVWKVTLTDGTPAALKVPRPDKAASERPAGAMLRYWQGDGAAQIIAGSDGPLLIEWLEGPSLGDQARAGDLDSADQTLAQVAAGLQGRPGAPWADLPTLDVWCHALLTFDLRRVSPDAALWFEAAARLAEDLIATAPSTVPLHGDLHHDNIIITDRGPLAFDPKGLMGDPAYEPANAFRNPRGVEGPLTDPIRIDALAQAAAEAMDVPYQRVIGWAAVKSALSLAWSLTGTIGEADDHEYRVLAALGRSARRHFG
ncbi:MAG: aminoglycoside phosphotransferase family protein [Pseudomonadota bacterium]